MIDTLLKFNRCLFEPIWIATLIGIALLLYLDWKKKRGYLFWFVFGGLLFMVAWRLLINVGSSRYTSILLYPTVILASYACYRIGELLPAGKISRNAFYIFMTILVIICLGKNLRHNRFGDYIIRGCKAVSADADSPNAFMLLHVSHDAGRFQYYADIKAFHFPYNHATGTNADIKKLLKIHRYIGENFYIIFNSRNLDGFSSNKLGLTADEWRLIFSSYRNNRMHDKCYIYCYTPRTDRKTDAGEASQIGGKDNLLRNGGFETVLPEKSYQKVKKRLVKRGLDFFSGDILLPASWNMIYGSSDGNSEVELVSKNAITGKYSLRMSGASRLGIRTHKSFPSDNYRLTMSARGKTESLWSIYLYAYNQEKRYIKFIPTAHSRVTSDSISQYNFDITKNDLPSNAAYFLVAIVLNPHETLVPEEGEIFLDEIMLVPK